MATAPVQEKCLIDEGRERPKLSKGYFRPRIADVCAGHTSAILKDKQHGRTPLSWAAVHGHAAAVELLLKTHNIDLDAKEKRDEEYLSIQLRRAVKHKHYKIKQLPIAEGADHQAQDEHVKTPHLLPSEQDLDSTTKLPFDQEACLEPTVRNLQTPLSLAAVRSHSKIVGLLLDHGANNEAKDKLGRTPLSLAAGKAGVSVVKLLLERDAALESQTTTVGLQCPGFRYTNAGRWLNCFLAEALKSWM
ncbi:hypothetical protein ETB97_007669 [Aspergillus alliaceus]|uniref:Uncharacterized protein n=1 Tax=Petromyces alliaceus TaxID=209559 RepID=A0A8H5ZW95_PETAA|nr:hypothetical protein ETB97_007669 [Aspergillus burnettii]